MEDLYFIDVEASGFGEASYPIEVGYVHENKKFCALIKPLPEWTHWDPSAEKLHGISRQLLEQHGKPADAVCRLMNEELAHKTLYTDAWANDKVWLWKLFSSCQQVPRFTLESVRKIIDEDNVALWHSEKNKIVAGQKITRHRASNDALVLQKTYFQLH